MGVFALGGSGGSPQSIGLTAAARVHMTARDTTPSSEAIFSVTRSLVVVGGFLSLRSAMAAVRGVVLLLAAFHAAALEPQQLDAARIGRHVTALLSS